MYQDPDSFNHYVGSDHDAFLSKKSGCKPSTYTEKENQFRGVRSGIKRKTSAALNRIKAGNPKTRAERQQAQRAMKYMLTALGAVVLSGDKTVKTFCYSYAKVGMMLRIARAIWLKESYRQFSSGGTVCLDEMYEAQYQAGVAIANEILLKGGVTEKIENATYDDAFEYLNYVTAIILVNLEDSLTTDEDRRKMCLTGEIPDPLGIRQEKDEDLHTNHIYLSNQSTESLSDNLKTIVREATYSKVGALGWKTVCRIRARCYALIEKSTIEALHLLRFILSSLKSGVTCLGKRGKPRKTTDTPMTSNLEAHLVGLSGSIGCFLSRQFDLALYKYHTQA